MSSYKKWKKPELIARLLIVDSALDGLQEINKDIVENMKERVTCYLKSYDNINYNREIYNNKLEKEIVRLRNVEDVSTKAKQAIYMADLCQYVCDAKSERICELNYKINCLDLSMTKFDWLEKQWKDYKEDTPNYDLLDFT